MEFLNKAINGARKITLVLYEISDVKSWWVCPSMTKELSDDELKVIILSDTYLYSNRDILLEYIRREIKQNSTDYPTRFLRVM